MRKRIVLFFFCVAFAAHAQDRSRMAVYVPMPSGGTAEQRAYFESNFKMELIGANYPSAEERVGSLYTLLLDIADNLDFDTARPPDNDNSRYVLGIKLERSADSVEIVRFEFMFNDLETMANWNLYLLYNAMANAYVQMDEPGPEGDTSVVNNTAPPPDERWRGKTFYLNLAAGTDIGLLQKPGSARIQEGMLMPALFAGIEWVFLDFLALEVDLIKPRLLNDDSQNYFLSVTAPLLIKGVFRPGGVMLEPYVGVEAAFGLWGNAEIPLLSAIGGAQLGFRAGQSSAWTLDIGVTRNVFGTFSVAGDGYNLLRFHVMAGWKTGWKDRPPRAVKEQSVPVAE